MKQSDLGDNSPSAALRWLQVSPLDNDALGFVKYANHSLVEYVTKTFFGEQLDILPASKLFKVLASPHLRIAFRSKDEPELDVRRSDLDWALRSNGAINVGD